MSLSIVTLHGHLGRDAELKHTDSGQAVSNFNLAVSTKRGSEESTAWYRCALWGKRAESLQPYLTKGKAFIVIGSLVPREYKNKEDELRVSLDVNVSEISFAGGGGDSESRNGDAQRPSPSSADYDNDVPF